MQVSVTACSAVKTHARRCVAVALSKLECYAATRRTPTTELVRPLLRTDHEAWAPDYTIQVECGIIHLRKDRDCQADFLLFRDGHNLNERFCGLSYGVQVVSETGKMSVVFDTNRRKKQQGFNCTVTAVELLCPDPFVKVGSECFYLSDSGQVFGEARAVCLGLGGDLASPADVPALKDYIIDRGQTLAVWLGASDQDDEGAWQWFDGSPIKAEDWYWNAPNNGFGKEHCLVLRPDFDPPLNDAECDRQKKFVCEYDLWKV
ncbi:type-2 ice-structuring protein-like isoform X2 [Penaeus japonicus]|uniref:type-2 ice-structuring protein-like isoform X2 n=1 Tax=Penaeus japonicus TaxID=27405 RepID=UPI001C7152F3|nr:type-2 ice-structuring protein-like isoform X2 [Penaeus japonicus]